MLSIPVALVTSYRNFLKLPHFEVNVETEEEILFILTLVDSIQIFQSLIRLANNVVFCSLIAREFWYKNRLSPTWEKISI